MTEVIDMVRYAFGRPFRTRLVVRIVQDAWPVLTPQDRDEIRQAVADYLRVTGGWGRRHDPWIRLLAWIGEHEDRATVRTTKGTH